MVEATSTWSEGRTFPLEREKATRFLLPSHKYLLFATYSAVYIFGVNSGACIVRGKYLYLFMKYL
jgi:hypothetical protein